MKILNFYPYYEALLRTRTKSTTIRFGDQTEKYHVGDDVIITVGWNEESVKEVGKAYITSVQRKKVKEIDQTDLNGEGPDFRNVEAAKYVLSAIYRKIVDEADTVTIVKWKRL